MLEDLRFGLRLLRRAPGFAILAAGCLTLGIGANTAVISWIEGVLLRPYPKVADQEHLLVLAGTARGASRATAVSWPDFEDYRRSATLFDAFIADRLVATTLSIGDRAERAAGELVSANYFVALGARPALGRGFTPEEERGRNAHPNIVISYRLWRERFGGDPNIIGRRQMLNGVPHTIVGVAPEGFLGTFVPYAIQFWAPISMQELFEPGGYKLEDRQARWIEGFARPMPGVTTARAQAELSAIADRLAREYPETSRGRGVTLLALRESPFNGAALMAPALTMALGGVGLLLLIACANVANLIMVRSLGRRREMAVRLAIGASHGRVLRQLVTENLVLASIAAAAGLLVAVWCRNALVLFLPASGVPMYASAGIDWRVLGTSAAIALAATVLFGLAPAVEVRRLDLVTAIKSGVSGAGRKRAWLRPALVLAQVSLSFVLLVGAGLLLRSFGEIRRANPGFRTRDVLNASVDLKAAGYSEARGRIFLDQLADRVEATPGVTSSTMARITPLGVRGYSSTAISVEGFVPPPDAQTTVEYNEVGEHYFETLGIPLAAGREFRRSDTATAPLVAIVNESMARRYWQGRDALGQRFQAGGRWMQVVAIAKNARYRNLSEPDKPFFYVPLRQAYASQVVLHIRSERSIEGIAAALAREMHAIDPDLAASSVMRMQDSIELSASTQRIALALTGVFGGLAVLLAAVGFYGVMAWSVSQNARDLGIRMALGAARGDVVRQVMASGLRLTGLGVGIGVVLAGSGTRLMEGLLYKVGPRDGTAFAAAAAVMLLASVAACAGPAWRAAQTDPLRVLRES